MSDGPSSRQRELRSYCLGYALALLSTCTAFATVRWGSKGTGSVTFILVLALIQAVVHFRYFLHITFARSARDDLWLILFGFGIIALMTGGTLFVLADLANRMM